MALRRTGVLFKVRNPGKIVMTGKLQVTPEMMKEWSKYPKQTYKEKSYVEIEIGLFKNESGDKQYYPMLEFLPGDDDGGQQQGEDGGDDDGLPF